MRLQLQAIRYHLPRFSLFAQRSDDDSILPWHCGFICTTNHPLSARPTFGNRSPTSRAKASRNTALGAAADRRPPRLLPRVSLPRLASSAATLGVFSEKPGADKKPGSAGWYNAAASDWRPPAKPVRLPERQRHAFSNECRDKGDRDHQAGSGSLTWWFTGLAGASYRMLPVKWCGCAQTDRRGLRDHGHRHQQGCDHRGASRAGERRDCQHHQGDGRGRLGAVDPGAGRCRCWLTAPRRWRTAISAPI